MLQVDTAKLTAALASSPDEVKALFATNGTSTLSTIQYMGAHIADATGDVRGRDDAGRDDADGDRQRHRRHVRELRPSPTR